MAGHPTSGAVSPELQASLAARHSYGRLLAILARQWGDIALAEDALAEAFATALQRWPADGVPESPDAWLLTVARRVLLMHARRQRLHENPAFLALWPGEEEEAYAAATQPVPDDRLRLMFACTHEVVEPSIRSALIMQTVLSIDVRRLADAFLLKPDALAKRLVRAKAKIKASGVRFEEPGRDEYPARLGAVLEAVYGCYTLHSGEPDSELAGEAVYLAQLLASEAPEEPEALGLLALLFYCEARRPAGMSADGVFIPMDQQDTALWNQELIGEAEQLLVAAFHTGIPGPYQMEAAIQSAHIHGLRAGSVPWPAIAQLYTRLLEMSPTIGARVGHAVAVGMGEPELGLRLLEAIEPARAAAYQSWWAARAELLVRAGRTDEARDAYRCALALTADPAVRAWLARK